MRAGPKVILVNRFSCKNVLAVPFSTLFFQTPSFNLHKIIYQFKLGKTENFFLI
jgi:hypothetical protein